MMIPSVQVVAITYVPSCAGTIRIRYARYLCMCVTVRALRTGIEHKVWYWYSRLESTVYRYTGMYGEFLSKTTKKTRKRIQWSNETRMNESELDIIQKCEATASWHLVRRVPGIIPVHAC